MSERTLARAGCFVVLWLLAFECAGCQLDTSPAGSITAADHDASTRDRPPITDAGETDTANAANTGQSSLAGTNGSGSGAGGSSDAGPGVSTAGASHMTAGESGSAAGSGDAGNAAAAGGSSGGASGSRPPNAGSGESGANAGSGGSGGQAPRAGTGGGGDAGTDQDLLSRLASVLSPAQLKQITNALANGTVTAALLTELVTEVQTAGACGDSHVACRQLCAGVLAQCVDCAPDGNTQASWVRTCNAL